MGLVPVKALVLIQLSVLLLSCFIVFGDEVDSVSWALSPHHPPTYPPVEAPNHHKGHHHHRGHPVSQPPSHPPTHSPSHSLSHPPTHSPSHSLSHPPSYPIPTRKFVAVQGVVYCKSCKYAGVDTLLGASPLLGAIVKLQCNNTKYPLVQQTKTDKNGYFFIMAPKNLTTYGSHKCKVTIVSSPLATCNNPTNLHFGLKGAILMPTAMPPVPSPPHPLPFYVFSVGPFAFEPSSKVPCPH